MSNIFQSALFKKPQYSKFNLSHDWKGSYEIGQLVPAYWRFVHPGERFMGRVEQLTRFAPMLAPIMQQFDVTVDWHFCPMRLLNVGSEDFFNMQKNSDYSRNLPFVCLRDVLLTGVKYDLQGSLFDYFGYPVLDNLRSAGLADSMDNSFYSSDRACLVVRVSNKDKRILTLRGYSSYLVFSLNEGNDYNDFISSVDGETVVNDETYYSNLQKLRISEARLSDKYTSYIKSEYPFKDNLNYGGSDKILLSLLPFYAYWRIVSDWYVNPNYVDSKQFFDNKWNILDTAYRSSFHPAPGSYLNVSLFKPYLRNYASDYFTTAFLDTQAGNAVSIPTNGTIVDLRQANAVQKLRERALYAGKRYIDSVLAFFGVKSSDVRLDRTEVLARDNYHVNISAVTQTNQSDIDKMLDTPLGTYVGEGYSAGGRGRFDYTAEEHGIIMCMLSVRPKASYMQGINPLLTKSKVTDFIIPDLAQIGEQSIPNCHLFCDFDSDKNNFSYMGTFGYTRRYAEFMFAQSETHGDFRRSLNYWHATRMFDNAPTAGSAFNEIDVDRDNLNRIFAVPEGVDHVYQYLYFDIDCISPLPRYVHYDL